MLRKFRKIISLVLVVCLICGGNVFIFDKAFADELSEPKTYEDLSDIDLQLQNVLTYVAVVFRGRYFNSNEQANDEKVYTYTRGIYDLLPDSHEYTIDMTYDEFIEKVDSLFANHSDLKAYLTKQGEYDEATGTVSLKYRGGSGDPDHCEYVGYEKTENGYTVYGQWVHYLWETPSENEVEGIDYFVTTFVDDEGTVYKDYWKYGDKIILELNDSVDGKYQIQAYTTVDDFNFDKKDNETTTNPTTTKPELSTKPTEGSTTPHTEGSTTQNLANNTSQKNVSSKQDNVKKPSSTKIKSLIEAKKALKISWEKVKNVNGYQIQYSTSSKFKKAKNITIKKAKTTSKTIKKLQSKKKYYVRIRTYIMVNGKKKYSSWSKKKSQKTK